MAFLEVDKILEITPNSIKVQKLLTYTDEYFQDHFPRKAVMPGVLMLETFLEAARWFIRKVKDFSPAAINLKEVENLRFGRFLKPGDKLVVELSLLDLADAEAKFKGAGYMDGHIALRGAIKVNFLGELPPEAVRHNRRRFDEIFIGSTVSS